MFSSLPCKPSHLVLKSGLHASTQETTTSKYYLAVKVLLKSKEGESLAPSAICKHREIVLINSSG